MKLDLDPVLGPDERRVSAFKPLLWLVAAAAFAVAALMFAPLPPL